MSTLPAQTQALAVAARNPDELYARLGQIEERQRQVADTEVAGLLGRNREQMIDAGLNDWQTMRSLNRSVQGNPQAEAALTRAVWDRAVKAAGPDTLVNADKLHKFNDNRRSALPDVMSAWRSTIAMIFMPFPRFVGPRLDEG